MPRINLIGASNLHTNNTCEFGSMPGLAPTTGVRPWVTSLNGYKYSSVAVNGVNWLNGAMLTRDAGPKAAGCGLGKFGTTACNDGKSCLKQLNLFKGSTTYMDPVRGRLLG